ncbi:MAG: extracellular solute-binding protein [Candidatus Cloacimonadaceae bacterium]|nr:extracellular solute-binding protein [Candidatus Cloacimonadota bacterium]MDY0128379.1 extracellular solute-binding protein [Candidatus Cloacimonadaceae bacterium]MCB5254171.1 extracellular solute-binding protein [Candidatus Cloacimonadota bacterium]MCK9178813.1 extracellular solute-binding protein [Candidatus Cloacimonadota bacterium]MCK9242909.1 extracellular solute-binding protein [Candidatus Cloacimonadota bacterium]
MRRLILILPLILLLACTPSDKKEQVPQPRDSSTVLRLYAPVEFRSSGLEKALIESFRKEHNCSVEIRLFDDLNLMIQAISAQPDSIDVVLGLPGCFALSDSLDGYFLPYSPPQQDALARDIFSGAALRLVPYGFSYLSVIYNSALIQPPTSFGQLQDAMFLKQLAVLNPRYSGPGRATVHWIVSIFGDAGYSQMLRALKKNVYRQYNTHFEAISALKTGEIALMLGLSTWPGWQKEISEDSADLDFALFDEGSFRYTECMGIHEGSSNPALAGAFLDFMLQPAAQKMVIYKLGLFPVNQKTLLPAALSDVPLSPWLTNDKISEENIRESSSTLLSAWERVMGHY